MTHKQKRAIVLIGDANTCVDIEYATGFRAPDAVVFLKVGTRRLLVVSSLEAGRATRVASARGIEVVTPAALGLKGAARRRLSCWVLAALRRGGVRHAEVSATFPIGVARELERAGVAVAVAREAIFPERGVKTAREVACMREAQQAAVLAMRAATAMIGASAADGHGRLVLGGRVLTSELVRRRIAGMLLDHGCEGRDTIVAGGEQAADPHEVGHGPLRADEAIVIDIFPRHMDHGYWGDLTRTVVKGCAPAALRRQYLAVRAAQQAALAAVRPRVSAATVHRAAVAVLERRGFPTRLVEGRAEGFIHLTGHGVGLAIHEGPTVGPAGPRLRQGHVITIEPGLYYPGVGGIRIEDTIVVTAAGWRYLVPCEKHFEL